MRGKLPGWIGGVMDQAFEDEVGGQRGGKGEGEGGMDGSGRRSDVRRKRKRTDWGDVERELGRFFAGKS